MKNVMNIPVRLALSAVFIAATFQGFVAAV
jgi:hypothetical protein